MKIVRIFANENYLLVVHYTNEELDEFARLFDEWTDVEFLEDFFTKNEKDLQVDFWKEISVEEAVRITIREASDFRKLLLEITKEKPAKRRKEFIELFKPLEDTQSRFDFLDKKKAYGMRKPSWLRMYALKISDDMYLITGGAIKLTKRMGERKHTKKELVKIERCKQYLKDQGVVDEFGMIEILEI